MSATRAPFRRVAVAIALSGLGNKHEASEAQRVDAPVRGGRF